MLQQTMTVDEAAGYLHVTPRTVRDWIAAGKIRASRVGKRYIISTEAVSKLISAPVDESDEVNSPERKAHAQKLFELLSGGDREKGRAAVLAARERDMAHRKTDRRRL